MANKELAAYIMEQLNGLEEIRGIPMMGGYIFYYKDRIFGGIYEPGFMVKVTQASQSFMPDSKPEPPYSGAKPMLPVTIADNSALLKEMVDAMYPQLPARKPGKKKKERGIVMTKLSCCGTDCSACSYCGTVCKGCNESTGKPFHVAKDETCPIYTCAVKDKKYKDCSKCTSLPCPVWRDTRDPAFTDEAFEANINERIANLKGMPDKESIK